MPTKVEQSDLLQVLYGRNGESPIPVVAPATPGECFTLAIEAARIALKYMTPVVYLSDAFVANGAEPWQVPVARRPAGHLGPERDGQATAPVPARTRATRRPSPGRGPSPAPRASSTASAASRRPTAWATSATTPRTTTR